MATENETRSRGRGIVMALLTMAVATGLAVVAVEVALRIADYPPAGFSPWVLDRDTGMALAPNLDQRMVRAEFDVPFRTNSLGLRDDEVGPKQRPRILLIGDSFTVGYGVPRAETYGDRLEKGLGVEVVNAAVGGFDLINQVHYMRAKGAALEPDLVVFGLYLGNDLTGNFLYRWEEGRGLVPEKDYPVRVPNRIHLLELLRNYRYSRRATQADRREWQPYVDYLRMLERAPGEAAAHYDISRELLTRLKGEVAATGAQLLVVMFPYRTVVEAEAAKAFKATLPGFDTVYDLDRPRREMAAHLSAIGVDHLDLTEALRRADRERDRGSPLYYPYDGHFTRDGHRVVAEAVLPRVRALLAPPGDGG